MSLFFTNELASVFVSKEMNTDAPLPALSSAPAAELPLPADPALLQQMVRELLDALRKSQHECDGLRHRLDQLLHRLYGPKAERFDPNRPWLFPEAAVSAAPEPVTSAAEPAPVAKPQRAGHGRQVLPADLPRRRVEHTSTVVERLCPTCGVACRKFGEDVSEQLDYQPASLFVWQHVRDKYACPKCHDHVTAASAPVAIVDKGLPG